MLVATRVFAAIGFLVVLWVVVRLPFWIRDIRREERAERVARYGEPLADALEDFAHGGPTPRERRALFVTAPDVEPPDELALFDELDLGVRP